MRISPPGNPDTPRGVLAEGPASGGCLTAVEREGNDTRRLPGVADGHHELAPGRRMVRIDHRHGHGAAEGVRALEEHWDGDGHPRGLRGEEIPMVARLLGLAQILEVFSSEGGPHAGLALVRRRSGKWFDPTVVEACRGIEPLLGRWAQMSTRELRDEVSLAEPGHASLLAGTATLRRVAHVFAGIVEIAVAYILSIIFGVTTGLLVGATDEVQSSRYFLKLAVFLGKTRFENRVDIGSGM